MTSKFAINLKLMQIKPLIALYNFFCFVHVPNTVCVSKVLHLIEIDKTKITGQR